MAAVADCGNGLDFGQTSAATGIQPVDGACVRDGIQHYLSIRRRLEGGSGGGTEALRLLAFDVQRQLGDQPREPQRTGQGGHVFPYLFQPCDRDCRRDRGAFRHHRCSAGQRMGVRIQARGVSRFGDGGQSAPADGIQEGPVGGRQRAEERSARDARL